MGFGSFGVASMEDCGTIIYHRCGIIFIIDIAHASIRSNASTSMAIFEDSLIQSCHSCWECTICSTNDKGLCKLSLLITED